MLKKAVPNLKRWVSGYLVAVMTLMLVFNNSFAFSALAAETASGSNAEKEASASDAFKNSKVSLKNSQKEDVQFLIFSEQSSYEPGETVCLDLYIKNNTDKTITDGLLKIARAKGIEKDSAYFEDMTDLYEAANREEEKPEETKAEETEEGTSAEEKEELTAESSEEIGLESAETPEITEAAENVEDLLPTESEPEMRGDENIGMEIAGNEVEETVEEGSVAVEDETNKEDEEETDEEEKEEEPDRLSELEILPGKTAYINFYYTIDPEIEGMKDQDIRFSFDWTQENKDGKEEKHNKKEEFCYSVDALNLLTVTTGGEKGWVEVGKEDEMLLEFDLGQMREILDEAVEEELEKHEDDDASASEARRASASETLVGWDEENGSRPLGKKDPAMIKKLKCEVETFGLKLNKFKAAPVTDDDNYGTSLKCDFLVSRNNVPGTYYGRVKASYEIKNRTFHTTQGFKVVVKQETGEIELTGKIGDSEIIMSGPASAFPAGDDLALKVSEVTPEQQEKVDEALQKKAEEDGTEIKQYRALDIKLIVDGKEIEPDGKFQVRFKNVELEKIDEEKEEQEKPEEQSIVKRAMRRVMSLFTARNEENENVAAVTEAEETAEVADADTEENEKADSEKEDEGKEEAVKSSENIKVFHLDEEAISVTDMNADAQDNGDVVINTDHFSIYIIVNLPDNVKKVHVKVNHWAEVEQWKTVTESDGRKNASEEYKEKIKIPSWGKEVNCIKPGAKADGTYDMPRVKIYAEDEFDIPNGAGTGIEYSVLVDKFSKVSSGGNYSVKEITVNGIVYKNDKNTDENIPLQAGNNIIDIDYALTEGLMHDEVGFHDYNAMNQTEGDSVNKDQRGINHPKLQNGDIQNNKTEKNRIIVGNENLGFNHSRLKDDPENYSGPGTVHKGLEITKNIVKTNLTDTISNTLEFNNIVDPGLFIPRDIPISEAGHPKYAKKYITDYELEFKRKGDTYTLHSVIDKNGEAVKGGKDLDILGESHPNPLYSNLFWPLDNITYKEGEGDPQIGGKNFGFAQNDEDPHISPDVKHNWLFGMRYDFNFTLGDYIGPMNYYFRGDDDFWLYIDGELIVDIGGIHSAMGQFVDLRTDWIDKKLEGKSEAEKEEFKKKSHRMTIYYMERGGFGSCCYMTFTLPNAQPVAIPGAETVFRTVQKKWIDGNVDELRKEVQVQLYQDNIPFGNAVTLNEKNGWQYTWDPLPKFKNSTNNELHDYWVKEVVVPPGYESNIDLDTVATNEEKLVNPDIEMSGNITVETKWKGDSQLKKPDKIKFKLYKKIGERPEILDGKAELSEQNCWSYKWTEKPFYDTSSGQKITYRVEAIKEVEKEDNKTSNFDLIMTRTGDISIKKEWPQNSSKPPRILLQLYKQIGNNNEVKEGELIILSEENEWKYTVESIPFNNSEKDIIYRLEERTESGNSFRVINTRIGNVKVEKKWEDEENKNSSRPRQISVQLFKQIGNGPQIADGKPIILSKKNNWKYTWKNKKYYDFSGQQITYSVEEQADSWLKTWKETEKHKDGWYIGSIEDDFKNGFTITNTLTKTNIQVIKEWKDNDNAYNLRPESIPIILQVNTSGPNTKGEYQETDYQDVDLIYESISANVELDASKEWSYKWENLPTHTFVDSKGNLLEEPIKNKYRIREDPNFLNEEYYEKPDWIVVEQEEGKETVIKLTNTLKMAKLRVTKHVATEALISKLVNSEVVAEPIAKPYKFIIVIENKEDPNERYEVSLLHDETSNYIWIPMGNVKQKTFTISETEPMEYTMISMELIGEGIVEDNKIYATKVNEDGTNTKELLVEFVPAEKVGTITLYPDADAHVQVNNLPEHTDYFHHTYSVTNKNQMNSSMSGNGFGQKDGYYDERNQHATDETVPKKQAEVTTEYDYAVAYMGEAVNGKEKKMDWGDDLNAWT